jgi:hypothetical protein
MQVINE